MMDKQILEALEKAHLQDYFASMPPSHQKEYIQWIMSAKKAETKLKRIEEMIAMLAAKRQQS